MPMMNPQLKALLDMLRGQNGPGIPGDSKNYFPQQSLSPDNMVAPQQIPRMDADQPAGFDDEGEDYYGNISGRDDMNDIFQPQAPRVQRNPDVPGRRPGTGSGQNAPDAEPDWDRVGMEELQNSRIYRNRFPGSDVDFGEQQGMIANHADQRDADRKLTPEQQNNIDRQMDYEELSEIATAGGRRDLDTLEERDVPTGLSARDLDDREMMTQADMREMSDVFSGKLDEDIQALGTPEDHENASQMLEMFIQLHGEDELPDDWTGLLNQRQNS